MQSLVIALVALLAGYSSLSFARSCNFPDDIWFEINANGLSAQEKLKVARLVEKAMSREGIPVIVAVGHADTQEGSSAHQQSLSLQRAESVREYIGRNWPELARRTHVEGAASRQRLSSSENAKNRRVEIVVYCNDTAMPIFPRKP